MKWRWQAGNGQDAAELEALQTDVMRFVAILGLCLAAIFSLLQGTTREQREPPAPAVAVAAPATVVEPDPVAVAPAPEPVERRVAPGESPPELPSPAPESSGYSLSFTSAADLHRALEADIVQLYAFDAGTSWRYDARQPRFVAASTPANYHAMHPDTVPVSFSRRLARVTDISAVAWGVVLPIGTIDDLHRELAREGGGELLIDARGKVARAGN